jgi:hypothetical protein
VELKNAKFVPFSFRERLAHVLIGIMADNADSNLISRGGIEALEEVRREAREALVAGGTRTHRRHGEIPGRKKPEPRRLRGHPVLCPFPLVARNGKTGGRIFSENRRPGRRPIKPIRNCFFRVDHLYPDDA